jgi:hypothetical protein
MAAAGEGPGQADGTLDTAASRQLAGGTLQSKTDTPKKQTSLGRFFKRPDSTTPPSLPDTTSPAASLKAIVAVEQEEPHTPQNKRKRSLTEQACEEPVKVSKPDTRPLHRRGGRPKKTEDSTKSRYTVLTGVQRLYIIQMWDQKIKAGISTRTARQQLASFLSCSTSAVKTTVQNREYWTQWGQERSLDASTSPNKARRRGDSRSVLKMGSTSKGCRRPGTRGYLGTTFWSKKMVQQVQLWSEMETEQGHDLGRTDLYEHFVRLLDSAVAYGNDAEEAGTITPEEAVELSHLKQKQKTTQNERICPPFPGAVLGRPVRVRR